MKDEANRVKERGICALCEQPYDHFGNNPQPVLPNYEQRVCNDCNRVRVIPARLRILMRAWNINKE